MISAFSMVVDYKVIAMVFDDGDFKRSVMNFAVFKVAVSDRDGPWVGLIEWAPVLDGRDLPFQRFVGRLSMYVLHGDDTVHWWLAAHAEFNKISPSSAMVLMHPTATDFAWSDCGMVSRVVPPDHLEGAIPKEPRGL